MPFEEGFLTRWSRRKAEDRSAHGESTLQRDAAPEMNFAQAGATEPAPALDCASLDLSSDFSRFVRDGISNAVQTAALRRLWVTSPLFSASDGLDVYRADYARASPLGEVPDIASRALQIAAAEQCAADRSGMSAPPSEGASDAQEQTSRTSEAQEPQSSD